MKQDFGKIVGDRVRYYRKRSGMSQEELGFRAKLHTSFIGEIERGEKSPTLESLNKISTALGITLSALFDRLQSVNQTDQDDTINEIVNKLYALPSHEVKSISTMIDLMINFRRK